MTQSWQEYVVSIWRAAWLRFNQGYEQIGGTSAVINAAVTIIAFCFALFTYWALWQDVVKLDSEQVVRVDPE
jgi:hypothetical protein